MCGSIDGCEVFGLRACEHGSGRWVSACKGIAWHSGIGTVCV